MPGESRIHNASARRPTTATDKTRCTTGLMITILDVVRGNFPAGQLALTGQFVTQHLDDILRIVRHQEGFEKAEHPLNRIMNIEDTMGAIVVTTTEIHLLRRIGEALKRAFDGELKSNYDKDGYFLRATWHRV